MTVLEARTWQEWKLQLPSLKTCFLSLIRFQKVKHAGHAGDAGQAEQAEHAQPNPDKSSSSNIEISQPLILQPLYPESYQNHQLSLIHLNILYAIPIFGKD